MFLPKVNCIAFDIVEITAEPKLKTGFKMCSLCVYLSGISVYIEFAGN